MTLRPDDGIVHNMAEVPDSRTCTNVSPLVNDRRGVYVAGLGSLGWVGHRVGNYGDRLLDQRLDSVEVRAVSRGDLRLILYHLATV